MTMMMMMIKFDEQRFLVHPSIHHKTNEHRSSQKKHVQFSAQILTDKFIIKKHHYVQIWNFFIGCASAKAYDPWEFLKFH